MNIDGAIGIDLGGSSVKFAAVAADGEVRFKSNVAFEADAALDWASTIKAHISDIQKTSGIDGGVAGLSAPGLASSDGRSIAYMPGRLNGLEGFDWTTFLGFSNTVTVLNDAHAALCGEAWIGAAAGARNVIMLTLGTGVGGAAIVDGRLLRGQIGRAGHLGHTSIDTDGPRDVCRAPGSLEVAIGNCTIRERTGNRFESTHELIAAHLNGDREATEIWMRSVKALARAICSFINILDPEAVIIGGGIARAGETLFAPLRRFLDPIEWKPGGHQAKIVPARLGEYAGAVGAARNAILSAAGSRPDP